MARQPGTRRQHRAGPGSEGVLVAASARDAVRVGERHDRPDGVVRLHPGRVRAAGSSADHPLQSPGLALPRRRVRRPPRAQRTQIRRQVAAGGTATRREQRDHLGGHLRTDESRAVQQCAGVTGIGGHPREVAPAVRGASVGVERPEPAQHALGAGDLPGRRLIGQRQALRPGRAPAGHVQREGRQVRRRDRRRAVGGQSRVLLLGQAAHREPGAEAGGAARALHARVARRRHRHQPRHVPCDVSPRLAAQARVHHQPHPGHSQ